MLTATDSPIAKQMVAGFKAGAEKTNSGVKVIHAFVGDWNDVVKGKELVKSMVKEGADVIYTQSGQVNVGAIEAAAESGILAIGSIVDMHDIAPDTVVSSAVAPPGAMVSNMIEMFINGTLEGKLYEMGIKDGVEDLAPYHNFEDKLPQEVKDQIQEIRQDIIDGKITKPTA
jgi:basic membrane protein A